MQNQLTSTLAQLKFELKSKNLPVKGKKAELRKRLTQSLESKVTETKISENKSEENSSCNDLLKVTDSKLFLHRYNEFQNQILEKVTNVKNKVEEKCATEIDEVHSLQKENEFLKQELMNKQTIINVLLEDIKKHDITKD